MSKELVAADHFHLGVLGRSGSGKTEYIKAWLRAYPGIMVKVFCNELSVQQWRNAGVEYCYTNPTDLTKIINAASSYKKKNNLEARDMPKAIIIFDDFMASIRHLADDIDKQFRDLSTVGRHLGIRIIVLAHDATHFPKYMRTQFTHMALMRGTDAESFKQIADMMSLEFSRDIWEKLSTTSDHSVLLMQKGNYDARIEKASQDTNEISSHSMNLSSQNAIATANTSANIMGDNNSVNQINMAVARNTADQINEIKMRKCIEYEKHKADQYTKALVSFEWLHDFFFGSAVSNEFIETATNNAGIICKYLNLPKPVNTDKWLQSITSVMIMYEFYCIDEMEDMSQALKKRKKKEIIDIYGNKLKKNLANLEKVTRNRALLRGDFKTVAFTELDKYDGKRLGLGGAISTTVDNLLVGKQLLKSIFG